MTIKTRTFSFTIHSTDALAAWTYLCTIDNYEYLCMNIKKNTITGFIRFKNAKKSEQVKNLLQFNADVIDEHKPDIEVRKKIYMNNDKFFENGIPKKNTFRVENYPSQQHHIPHQPIVKNVIIDEETKESIVNSVQERNKSVLEEIKQQTKIVNDLFKLTGVLHII